MKNISKLALGSVLAVAVVGAHAATVGSYVGASAGYSKMNMSRTSENYKSLTDDRTGLAGRIFAGYNMSETLGFEMGIARPATETLKAKDETLYPGKAQNTLTITDIVAKAYFPVTEKVDLFGKAGLAYMHSSQSYSGAFSTAAGDSSGTANAIRPELGVGASYALTQNVSALAEYSYIYGSKRVNTATPSVHMATVGLAYNFS